MQHDDTRSSGYQVVSVAGVLISLTIVIRRAIVALAHAVMIHTAVIHHAAAVTILAVTVHHAAAVTILSVTNHHAASIAIALLLHAVFLAAGVFLPVLTMVLLCQQAGRCKAEPKQDQPGYEFMMSPVHKVFP
jgi:hypothetical protein